MNDQEKPEKKSQSSPKNVRRLVRRVIWFVLFALVAAGVVAAVLPKPVPVETASVTQGELVVTVDEDGVSRVNDRYVVSAPISGNLARMELHAGDQVKQGQVVARILPLSAPLLDARSRQEAEARVNAAYAGLRQANAQIDRAKVALDYSREEAANSRQLSQQGSISRQEADRAQLDERSRQAELASAEFAAKVASHELAMARSALGRYEGKTGTDDDDQFVVTSPVAGRVLKVFQQSEGVVQAGAQLLEVGDPSAMEIAADVLTSDAVHIEAGAPVVIEEWGGAPLAARVRLIEPSAFTRVSALGVEEQRVNAVVDLNEPYEKWKALGDGYRVEARIQVYRNPKAIMVPWSSLFRRGADWAVFVAKDGKAQLRVIEVGRRNDTEAEVKNGLSSGERVVLHPSDRVADGVEVTVDAAAQTR